MGELTSYQPVNGVRSCHQRRYTRLSVESALRSQSRESRGSRCIPIIQCESEPESSYKKESKSRLFVVGSAYAFYKKDSINNRIRFCQLCLYSRSSYNAIAPGDDGMVLSVDEYATFKDIVAASQLGVTSLRLNSVNISKDK